MTFDAKQNKFRLFFALFLVTNGVQQGCVLAPFCTAWCFFMRTHDFHKYHSEADTAKMCWWCQHNVWWILITHIFNGEFLVGQKEKLEGYSKSQGKTKHALTYETTEYLVLRSYYLRRITKEKPGLHGWPWWHLRQNNRRRLGGTVTSHVPLAWPRWFCKSLLNGQEEVTGREKRWEGNIKDRTSVRTANLKGQVKTGRTRLKQYHCCQWYHGHHLGYRTAVK